jgi:alanine racemase
MPNNPTTPLPNRPTWIEIDRNAIVNNIAQIRTIIGPEPLLTAVVKANAYGHDARIVGPIAQAAGVDRFAVASLSEGIELRQSGIERPILVLGYTPIRLVDEAIHHDIQLAVYDLDSAQGFDAIAESAGKPLTVHVKVNTGMNRLGISVNQDTQEALALFQALADLEYLDTEGIFTHFASSDLADKASAEQQFVRFQQLLDELDQDGLRPPVAHAANSAAMLTMPETHLEMVRAGIAIYGLAPDVDDTPLPDGFQPALTWKAEIAQVRMLQPGEGVSYGHEYVADQPKIIAVIPVGYADGFPRRPLTWESVLVRGRCAPILGRVCMDQAIIDVTDIIADTGKIRTGEEAVLIGSQGQATLSAA